MASKNDEDKSSFTVSLFPVIDFIDAMLAERKSLNVKMLFCLSLNLFGYVAIRYKIDDVRHDTE